MKISSWKIFQILFLIFFFNSCIKDQVVDTTPTVEITKSFSVKYTNLGKSPSYKQSNILCKFGSELYVFGAHLPVHIYNLNSGNWNSQALPNRDYGRWDGGALSIDNSIYIIGEALYGNFHDILIYNPAQNTYENTKLNLPFRMTDIAFGKHNKKIFFLNSLYDTLYIFDAQAKNLIKKNEHPFYDGTSAAGFSSGIYQNYFYVLRHSGFNSIGNIFYRLNVNSLQWEEIPIPSDLQLRQLAGASFGSQMLLFSDTTTTFRYSYDSKEWSVDKAKVPFYRKSPTGIVYYDEWSFCSDDTCLYGSEVWSQMLWKFSIK